MLPVNYGGHAAYQNTFISEFLNLFPAWQTRYTFPILPASFLSSVNRTQSRFHYRMVQAA